MDIQEFATEGAFERTKELNTNVLDALVHRMKEAEEEYKKAESLYKDYRCRILDILVDAGKSKYFVEGFGTVSTADRTMVATPKSREEKEAFFNWLKDKGEDFFWNYASVNSQSLNSLYKMEFEACETPDTFKIPGIGEPTTTKELRFRRA